MAKAIAKVEESGIVPFASEYKIAQFEPDELQELIQTNLDGEIDISSLPRIKCPSGGGQFFSILDESGRERPHEYIDGVIVSQEPRRAMWRKNLDEGGGGAPPDCRGEMVQIDTEGSKKWVGRGVRWDGDDPAKDHDCATCRFNEFLSADKGKGKKCPERKLIALLQPDKLLPALILLPVTSLRNLTTYMTHLFSEKQVRFDTVVTRVSLEADRNDANINYSKFTFECIQVLDKADAAIAKRYAKDIKTLLVKVSRKIDAPAAETSSAFDSADLQDMDPSDDDDGVVAYEVGGAFDTGGPDAHGSEGAHRDGGDDLPADL